jgi:CheY-like chemotaxis protein
VDEDERMTGRAIQGARSALLAEDHPRYRERVRLLLEGWGLRVVVAEDGREALARLGDAGPFDLLVTDLEMPHYTGFEVIEGWLRRGGAREAVIMVTGEADAADVRERCAAGGFCLIHKTAIDVRLEGAVREAVAWIRARGPETRGDTAP